MQRVLSNARRLNTTRALKLHPVLGSAAHNNSLLSSTDSSIGTAPHSAQHRCQNHTFCSHVRFLSTAQYPIHLSSTLSALYSTEAVAPEAAPSENVKEAYDKIMDSVQVKRTMAPNAWLWSMIENCQNREDIKLLFETLHKLRIFRLSNLRIPDNFNCNLCREVTKACARVGAVDFGKKTLWTHNVYGISPSIASANHLLTYAKIHNDVQVMVDVMQLLKRNRVPLQPSTADIVFSVCHKSGKWDLISKYARRFLRDGVKLHRAAFDLWMDFAAKRGDTKSLWKIEELRSELIKQHSVVSGFACAKGLILERKPEDAATIIQVLDQASSDSRKKRILNQLQKLFHEWPAEVIKHQPEDTKEALAATLKSEIPAVASSLLDMGFEGHVNMEELSSKDILC